MRNSTMNQYHKNKCSVFFNIQNIAFIILVFCASSYTILNGQSREEDLAELRKIKSSKNFNSKSETYIDLLIWIGKDSYLYKPDSTTIYLDEAYKLSKNSNYLKGQCGSLNSLGYYYTNNGKLDLAYKNLNESLIIANKNSLLKEKVEALNFIGLALWHEGKNGLALSKFLEALPIAEKIKDVFMMGALNDNIALLYEDNKDYDTALLFNEKSRQISIDNNLEIALAETLLNMSGIYLKQKLYALANKTVDECIVIFKANNNFDWLSYSYVNKGYIALEQNKYKEAQEWFEKAIKICDEINLTIGYTETYLGMAETYLGLSNLDMAEVYGLKALKVSKDLNVFETIKESNSVLAKIYHNKGDYLEAYDYQTEYLRLFEKSTNKSSQKRLGILRSEISFENQKLQMAKENKAAIEKHRLYIFTAIAASLVLVIFLIVINKSKRTQKKLNSQLQQQQKALIMHESELQEANDTKDKLFSVIAHDLRGPINSFHSLIKLYVDNGLTKEEIDMIFPKALQEITRISDMLNNLLIWAKTQMYGSVNNPVNLDLRILVNENIQLLNPLAHRKSIVLINNFPENIISSSDRDHLDIVFRNLISNAIKFTNLNGEVTINVIELVDCYQIEIKDNGIGMGKITQSKLFNKNSTKTTYGTNNEKGTGIGLAISQEMVLSNGGKIWVDSKLNEGTSIFFTVPLSS
ncbi:tetratricopeptide repeat-containing sensor histidine kinase [Maribacter hydrothermalis]|uniref:histidine kinase n=1 Tax=Maribacter hydrothermalis TaxID=1836467 RepID=A0A1B7Z8C0_9FLAO|nr:ATP-binding protein [Maribacter hydrothermalis]APQ19033.1 hypothetical protein BTR34_17650 [Maribacter hydrothermalis]OBR38954.1 hypothetical protein A9200_04625 [Maribacter hydrothermalis]